MVDQRRLAVIFDFDGTIADSFARVVEIAQDMMGRRKPISDEELERLRGMSAFEVARELKIKRWKIPFLLIRGRARLRSEMSKIPIIKGIHKTIDELSNDGHKLYIMSSNSVSNIEVFLQRHGLAEKFIEIYGSVGIFSKARVLKKLLKDNKLSRDDAFYIGDEVRDVQAAKHADIKIIAVTWGYNNQEALLRYNPDQVVSTPKELAAIFRD